MRPTLALLLILVLAACRSAGGLPSSPVATDRVDLPKSYRFAPAAISIPVGARVTWTNSDNFTHNVHLVDDGGDTLTMKPGASVSRAFETPGVHRYECSLHPRDMQATILVSGD